METGIQSSFIPKDAGDAQRSHTRGGGLSDLLLMFAIVAFAASAALAVAVFLYLQFQQSTANSDVAQLKRAEQQFEPKLIGDLTRLDDRMHTAESILNTHVAPSAAFDALDQVTAKTISYASLQIQVSDAHRITLVAHGTARSVNSIAFQADILSKSGVFQNPIFSGLARQKDGFHFDLSALINPSAINYVQLTGGQMAGQTAAAVNAGAASTSAPSSPFGGAPAQGQ